MEDGSVFSFAIDETRRGLGKVIARDGDVASVALCGAVWDCEPLLEDIDEAPVALAHLPLRVGRLAGVTVLGARPVTAEERAEGYESWAATEGPRPVVDAPLAVLIGALL